MLLLCEERAPHQGKKKIWKHKISFTKRLDNVCLVRVAEGYLLLLASTGNLHLNGASLSFLLSWESKFRGDVIKTAEGFSSCCLKHNLSFIFFNNCFVFIKSELHSLRAGVSREMEQEGGDLSITLGCKASVGPSLDPSKHHPSGQAGKNPPGSSSHLILGI